MVHAHAAQIGVPLFHVWHQDRGFRLAEIRNLAILRSSGAICVFLDGDCLARPNFVSVHRRLAEPGWFVAGNRILLGPAITSRILEQRLRPKSWSVRDWMTLRCRGEVDQIYPLLTLPLGPLRKLRGQKLKGARGANLAIRREDLERVDGFDATYQGWGRGGF